MTYYHGTIWDKRLRSIMRNGLDPGKMESERRDEEPRNFVFLSRTIEGAEAFAPGGVHWDPKDERGGVILAVTPPRNLTRKFVYNLGEFIRVPMVIPAKYIKVVKFTNEVKG